MRRPRAPGGRRRSGKESPRVTAILRALALRGIWAWRANSGTQVIAATVRTGRRVIKGAPAGTPDILLVLPVRVVGSGRLPDAFQYAGSLCGLEVKADDGRQRPSQRAWQAKAERHGVRYAVVRSVIEALAVVDRWLADERRAA
jgi:hypothetical protein